MPDAVGDLVFAKMAEEWDFFDKRSDWITSYLVKYIGFGHVIFISNNGKAYYETRGPDGVKHKIRIEDHGTWQAIAYNYTDAGYGVVLQTMRDRVRQFVTDHNANTTITRHSALRWNAVTGNAAAKQAAAKGYRVYRSNDDGKTYRLLGTTNGVNAVTFDDKNLAFASNATRR